MCHWLAYAIYATFFQMYANIRTYACAIHDCGLGFSLATSDSGVRINAYVICAYMYARHIPTSERSSKSPKVPDTIGKVKGEGYHVCSNRDMVRVSLNANTQSVSMLCAPHGFPSL